MLSVRERIVPMIATNNIRTRDGTGGFGDGSVQLTSTLDQLRLTLNHNFGGVSQIDRLVAWVDQVVRNLPHDAAP